PNIACRRGEQPANERESAEESDSSATSRFNVGGHTGQHHGAIVLNSRSAGHRAFGKRRGQLVATQNILLFDVHLHLNIEIRKYLRRELQSQTRRLVVNDREAARRKITNAGYGRTCLDTEWISLRRLYRNTLS